jgi:hypothetical protein
LLALVYCLSFQFDSNPVDAEEVDADFYGVFAQSFPSLERPRSPSLLLDLDAFSSNPSLLTTFARQHSYNQYPPTTTPSEDTTNASTDVSQPRSSRRGLLGPKGAAVLNKVLPRSFRLKRWNSTPALPKLQISSPPPMPRMPSISMLPSPTLRERSGSVSAAFPTRGLLVPPPNTAFDYDPYSEDTGLSDDEDDEVRLRPTTRGTMMSREQLPTPPFLPSIAPALPYFPPLDSPVSLSSMQSPSASVHNLALSTPLVVPTPSGTTATTKSRNNSITSLSNTSLTSIASPLTSPTILPSHAPAIINIAGTSAASLQLPPAIRALSATQSSPQLNQHSLPALTEEVEDLLKQMELEDTAFAATEARMKSSGWSTETELHELRAKRATVRREWEDRIEVARKKRRGSVDEVNSLRAGTATSSVKGGATANGPMEPTTTPIITIPGTSTT